MLHVRHAFWCIFLTKCTYLKKFASYYCYSRHETTMVCAKVGLYVHVGEAGHTFVGFDGV